MSAAFNACVVIGAVVAVVVLLPGSSARIPVVIAVVAAYAVVALATVGSGPAEAPAPGERPRSPSLSSRRLLNGHNSGNEYRHRKWRQAWGRMN